MRGGRCGLTPGLGPLIAWHWTSGSSHACVHCLVSGERRNAPLVSSSRKWSWDGRHRMVGVSCRLVSQRLTAAVLIPTWLLI